ncbi:MAG: hypothetical protein F6K18_12385 [Okeania sp. SIO2C2]|uniref:hypothetical protein n=1 Tax=Okeania sp. SIO2C2 TaxID=2607787 RepID=UPI0013BE0679|nr:hypothetical protein [Okeania sp. SIO2C2]NEP87553.1 hypothetical protein [Okeania sp. SIO2C2]
MDDWVILAPTRWKLRKAIKAVNEVMADLQVEKHPNKTFIGRVSRGFEFLGYWFTPSGLRVAQKTVDKMKAKVALLYEQGASDWRIGDYLRRWVSWVRGGLLGVELGFGGVEWYGMQDWVVWLFYMASFLINLWSCCIWTMEYNSL